MKKKLLTILLMCLAFSAKAQTGTLYYEDFENGAIGWLPSPGSCWTIGAPNFGNAHSGSNVAGINASNSGCVLQTPFFNFTNSVDNYLSFWINYDVALDTAGVRIEYTFN